MDTKTNHIHSLLETGVTTENLPNLSDTIRHDSKYTRPHLVLDANPVLLTTPQFPSRLVDMRPHLDLARDKSSRHGVFTTYTVDELGNQREFAIKDSSLEVALGEVAMGHYLEQWGLNPFPTLAVVVDAAKPKQERSAWVITEYNPKAIGMNGLAWHEMDSRDIQHYAADALVALGGLHQVCVAHGDSHLRNIVRIGDGTTMQAQMIDFEHAVSFADDAWAVDEGDMSARARIERKLRCDLRRLVEDIDERSQHIMDSSTERWQLLRSCLDGYRDEAGSGYVEKMGVMADSAISALNDERAA